MLRFPDLGDVTRWGSSFVDEVSGLPAALGGIRLALVRLPERLESLVGALERTTEALDRALPELTRAIEVMGERVDHVDARLRPRGRANTHGGKLGTCLTESVRRRRRHGRPGQEPRLDHLRPRQARVRVDRRHPGRTARAPAYGSTAGVTRVAACAPRIGSATPLCALTNHAAQCERPAPRRQAMKTIIRVVVGRSNPIAGEVLGLGRHRRVAASDVKSQKGADDAFTTRFDR